MLFLFLLQGPRRKEDDVFTDKGGRGGPSRRPSEPPNLSANDTSAATPGSRRLDVRRPTAATRTRPGGAVHRHNHAFRPRAPGPPPGPRQPSQPGAPAPRPRRPVDLAYIYPWVRRAGPRAPQQTHGHGDGNKRLPTPTWAPQRRRLPEMPDATVHTLYPPPVAKQDNNDFSNDV